MHAARSNPFWLNGEHIMQTHIDQLWQPQSSSQSERPFNIFQKDTQAEWTCSDIFASVCALPLCDAAIKRQIGMNYGWWIKIICIRFDRFKSFRKRPNKKSSTKLYFNCFFAIKIIVLSGLYAVRRPWHCVACGRQPKCATWFMCAVIGYSICPRNWLSFWVACFVRSPFCFRSCEICDKTAVKLDIHVIKE